MSDDQLRQLERAAIAGGPEDRARFARATCKSQGHEASGTCYTRHLEDRVELYQRCSRCGETYLLEACWAKVTRREVGSPTFLGVDKTTWGKAAQALAGLLVARLGRRPDLPPPVAEGRQFFGPAARILVSEEEAEEHQRAQIAQELFEIGRLDDLERRPR